MGGAFGALGIEMEIGDESTLLTLAALLERVEGITCSGCGGWTMLVGFTRW